MNEIDFVIPWVDGSDPEWRKSFNMYAPPNDQLQMNGEERFRDWKLLRYWFRGVEKFAPWVRKIHFITCGQIPEWLNLDAKKINWVKHEDYVPKEYLPVFNINPLELNLHRIPGLSDRFVYFNDDTFIINHIPEKRFFRNGLPCDTAVCNLLQPSATGVMTHVMANNMAIINTQFDKHEAIKRNWRKWFSLKYGKQRIRTALLYSWPQFSNLYEHHQPNAFLKSTYEEIWASYGYRLTETSMTRFRSISNCSQWLMRDWQLVKGDFVPINVDKDSRSCMIGVDDLTKIIHDIRNQSVRLLCINDSKLFPEQVTHIQPKLIEAFESILPDKSCFEK